MNAYPKAVWTDGYDPEEEDRYDDVGYGNHFRKITGWPAAVQKENGDVDTHEYHFLFQKTEYPEGDYVILHDGTDAWFQAYQEEIMMQTAYSNFTYGTALGTDMIRSYGSVTVDFSKITDGLNYMLSYFNWEEIGMALGASELAVFDPQKEDNALFAAVQYGENSAVVVFQKDEDGRYAFVSLHASGDPLPLEGSV